MCTAGICLTVWHLSAMNACLRLPGEDWTRWHRAKFKICWVKYHSWISSQCCDVPLLNIEGYVCFRLGKAEEEIKKRWGGLLKAMSIQLEKAQKNGELLAVFFVFLFFSIQRFVPAFPRLFSGSLCWFPRNKMIRLIQGSTHAWRSSAELTRWDWMSTAAMSHILTEEMLSWRTVVKNGRRSNILRLQAFLFWLFP